MKKIPVEMLALGLVVGALGLAEAAGGEDVVVYSGRAEKLIQPVLDAYTAKTGVKVRLLTGGATEMLNRIAAEGARTPADLLITNDTGVLEAARQRGLLRGASSGVIERSLPAAYRAPDSSWIALSLRARVLVYNPLKAQPGEIRSVEDLAHPRMKGRIGIVTSANESFVAGFSVYQKLRGEAWAERWLKGVKENAGQRVFAKHSQIVEAVARGEIDVGLVNHYYVYRHLAEKPKDPVAILYPDQEKGEMGVAMNAAGAGLVRHGKSRSALSLMEFLASPEGQRIFAEQNMEYPVLTKVPTHTSVLKREAFRAADVRLVDLEALRSRAIALIEKAGLR
ncbi:MAG: extracellular solute-binding protein [Nitrospirae bacterium]|nr:extracellular solute-binding protein [Nitrospirota bacterium]